MQRGRLTLHAVGEVAQVEDVVRLGGGRQQVGAHSLVDLNGRPHHPLDTLAHRVREVVEEPGQDHLGSRGTHVKGLSPESDYMNISR